MGRFLGLACAAVLGAMAVGAMAQSPAEDPAWRSQRDALVARFRHLAGQEGQFGAAWRPIYEGARPWYELWGGKTRHDVDSWMVPPDAYAAEFADDWERGKNLFAQDPRANIPLVFTARLKDGSLLTTNYWLDLPTGFPEAGRRWPLIVGLHGSGWLGHDISFVRGRRDITGPVRAFSVTPIDAAGPWKLDYLNAFLDHLLAILPIDPDRVYAEGHSLGGMAVWLWAEDNPERFAAISPRAGYGERYRLERLMHVPVWSIQGENDRVVPRLFDEQMVNRLEDLGAPVRYSVLAGVEHNMPGDLDEDKVIDWYLRQRRYRGAEPADPRDKLGIGPDGASHWTILHEPARRYFESGETETKDWDGTSAVVGKLGDVVHAAGLTADAALESVVLGPDREIYRLPVPSNLRTDTPPPAGSVLVPAQRYARFYFRGTRAEGLRYARQVVARQAEAAGEKVDAQGKIIVVALTIWPPHDADALGDYRLPLEGD